MDSMQIIQSQFLEPFRIVLMAALVLTTLRTSAQTGRAIPLVLGILFVAVMATMSSDGDRLPLIGAGIVTNTILVAIMLGIAQLWTRLAKRS